MVALRDCHANLNSRLLEAATSPPVRAFCSRKGNHQVSKISKATLPVAAVTNVTTATTVPLAGTVESGLFAPASHQRFKQWGAVFVTCISAAFQAQVMAGRVLIEAKEQAVREATDWTRVLEIYFAGVKPNRANHLMVLAERWDGSSDEERNILDSVNVKVGTWVLMQSEPGVLADAVADVRAGAALSEVARRLHSKAQERVKKTGSDLTVAMVEEIADSEQHIKELTRDIERLEKERADLTLTIAVEKEEKDKLERQATALNADLDKAQAEVKSLRARPITPPAAAPKSETNDVEIEERRGELRLLEKRLSDKRAELAQVESHLADIADIERQIDDFLSELTVDTLEKCLIGLPSDGKARLAAKIATLHVRAEALKKLVG